MMPPRWLMTRRRHGAALQVELVVGRLFGGGERRGLMLDRFHDRFGVAEIVLLLSLLRYGLT
jgi:hypothetical protein